MDARGRAGPSERDDLRYLAEREPQPPSVTDERQHAQDLRSVGAVARRRTARCGKNASRLVQAKGLPTQTAALRNLANEEAVSLHSRTISPAPWGKVN